MQKQAKTRFLDFSNQTIYVGLDVHHSNWKVSIFTDLGEHKTFSQSPCVDQLVSYLHTHFPGGRYRSVYEAGFCGFWIHESLCSSGVTNIVVNAADIPESHKDRRRKTDSRDARKLARCLRSGTLEGIYCPSRSAQELRSLVRHRKRLVGNQTRCKNRIKGLLQQYGISIPAQWRGRNWSRSFVAWLGQRDEFKAEGKSTLDSLLTELAQLGQQLSQIDTQLKAKQAQEPHQSILTSLQSVPGIGWGSSWILYTELIDIDRFASLDQLNSYCGLVPDTRSTGMRERTLGLTKRSNSMIRSILIECAWVAIRKDPSLQKAYTHYAKSRSRNKSIIRIAKKLLSRIRYLWKHQGTYQINHTPCAG